MNAISQKKRLAVYVVLVLLLVVGAPYGVWQLVVRSQNYVPQAFIESRRETASIAEQIVGLSNESSQNIAKIQEMENKGQYNEAIDAVRAEMARVEDMRAKGGTLLEHLSTMAESLPYIRPNASQDAALRAINDETSIVNRLISYNTELEDVLRMTQARLLYGENNNERMRAMIDRINEEIDAIEKLNTDFNAAMEGVEKGGK